jgi:flagellar biosynthesis/type III secretory pathway protein FliH
MNEEIEKLAEEYAKKRSELDPVYGNGLYYGYLEGFKKAKEMYNDYANGLYYGYLEGFKKAKEMYNDSDKKVIVCPKCNGTEYSETDKVYKCAYTDCATQWVK